MPLSRNDGHQTSGGLRSPTFVPCFDGRYRQLADISQSLGILATIFLTLSVLYGLGEHLADLAAKDPLLINKNQFYHWIFTTFAIITISLGKMTIIAFILQIESNTGGKRKWILYGFAISNAIVNIIILPIIWVQCTPTAKMWNNDLPGNCNGRLRNEMYGYFQGSKCLLLQTVR